MEYPSETNKKQNKNKNDGNIASCTAHNTK
jgi:hypothetical protein